MAQQKTTKTISGEGRSISEEGAESEPERSPRERGILHWKTRVRVVTGSEGDCWLVS